MRKIVSIGGGEIGRPREKKGFYPIETTLIDKEIIKLSGKKAPKILFIPTASNDSKGYFETVKKHFGKRLGCKVDVIFLLKEKQTKSEIQKKILSSDIIYVGGGNTLKMMTAWRKLGVDKILRKAQNKGIVLSGLSAGSICWFSFGNSDSRKFTSNSSKLIKVKGLGFIDALHCPHYDEGHRQKDLKRMMRSVKRIPSIALTSCCALEVIDNKYRIIKSKKSAKAFKIFWKNGKYHKIEIKEENTYSSLPLLLKK